MSNHRLTPDCAISFREDSPRPPVPGSGGGNGCEDYGPAAAVTTKICGLQAASKFNVTSSTLDLLASPPSLKCDMLPDVTGDAVTKDDCSSLHVRGFEPDGSTGGDAKFSEGITAPSLLSPLLPPSDSLLCLLDDACGMSFFRQFLRTEHMSDALDFWLTCTGFRKVEAGKRRTVAVAIYKKFVAHGSNRIGLSATTKQLIKDHLKLADTDQFVFDAAVTEIENILRHDFYPLFLKSDEYKEYSRNRSVISSPSSDCSSSGFSSKRSPTRGPLDERENGSHNCELGVVRDSISAAYQHPSNCITEHPGVVANDSTQAAAVSGAGVSSCLLKSTSPGPVRAPAASAFDSEIHSLSSDPVTDADTFSLTDVCSLDSCLSRSQLRCPPCIRCAQVPKSHVPTCRLLVGAPYGGSGTAGAARCMSSSRGGGNLAERNPQQFASLLMDALNQIDSGSVGCCDSRQHAAEHTNIRDVFRDGASGISVARCSIPATAATTFVGSSTTGSKMAALLAEAASDREESAQSILERHVSLVFDSPDNNQTPTGGTGTSAPDCRSPDLGRAANFRTTSGVGGVIESTSHIGRPIHNVTPSLLHTDSDVPAATVTHHSTAREFVSSHRPSHVGSGCVRHDGVGGRHHSPATAVELTTLVGGPTVGGGLSGALAGTAAAAGGCHHRQSSSLSCMHTETNEKVMMWMKVNELLQPSASHSVVASHKSVATTTTQFRPQPPQHQRVVGGGGGLGGGGAVARQLSSSSDTTTVLPAQPIVQDPSMPLLTPPDPTTQLEEARRRLQLEATTRVPPKSILCSSAAFGRDVCLMSSPFGQPATTRHVRDTNSMMLPHSCRPGERHPTASASVPLTTPVQGDATITVVYYLCDEPVPYRSRVHAQFITLAMFKDVIAKKGAYRYYFKHACNDFNSGFVYEELSDDNDLLPLIDGKICAKVVRVV